MTARDRLTLEEVLSAFDEHLRRTRGVCAGGRRNYTRCAGAFSETMSAGANAASAFGARRVMDHARPADDRPGWLGTEN